MVNGMKGAHRRADCALIGAMALVSVTGVLAREYNLYTDRILQRETEALALAAVPDSVVVTESPIVVAERLQAAQSECLAEALYYEARGEGTEGEKAVAEVVLQRTRDRNYPRTICGVVYDGVEANRRDCQFSFACDGAVLRPKDRYVWSQVRQLAEKIVTGAVKLAGETGHAIAYHSVDVAPAWAETMRKTVQIGNHIFYRRDRTAQLRLVRAESETPQRQANSPLSASEPDESDDSQEIEPEVQTSSAVGNGA
jgi:spore germination cell wall hydrolase CwlJ-like protein